MFGFDTVIDRCTGMKFAWIFRVRDPAILWIRTAHPHDPSMTFPRSHAGSRRPSNLPTSTSARGRWEHEQIPLSCDLFFPRFAAPVQWRDNVPRPNEPDGAGYTVHGGVPNKRVQHEPERFPRVERCERQYHHDPSLGRGECTKREPGPIPAAAATSGGTAGLYGNLRSAGNGGRQFVNTSSNATIGACQLMMAINATNRMNVTVGYGVYSVFANPRTVGVVCQYRVGTSGAWTSISPDSGSNPYSQAGGTTGLKTTASATLPAACNYQAVVQIRWAIWRGTETGNSSALGFDDATVGGTLDTDHDGDPDSTDPCPLVANVAPGQGCDDGNPNTGNDAYYGGLRVRGDSGQ